MTTMTIDNNDDELDKGSNNNQISWTQQKFWLWLWMILEFIELQLKKKKKLFNLKNIDQSTGQGQEEPVDLSDYGGGNNNDGDFWTFKYN